MNIKGYVMPSKEKELNYQMLDQLFYLLRCEQELNIMQAFQKLRYSLLSF